MRWEKRREKKSLPSKLNREGEKEGKGEKMKWDRNARVKWRQKRRKKNWQRKICLFVVNHCWLSVNIFVLLVEYLRQRLLHFFHHIVNAFLQNGEISKMFYLWINQMRKSGNRAGGEIVRNTHEWHEKKWVGDIDLFIYEWFNVFLVFYDIYLLS